MAEEFGLEDVQNLMAGICADWVNQLDLKIVKIHENGADFLWTPDEHICRFVTETQKIVSGQATMAVADTASFMTICALNGAFANCTTVDMSTNFLRPLFAGEIDVEMRTLSFGKRLVTTRGEFRQRGSEKLAASATGVFAYIE